MNRLFFLLFFCIISVSILPAQHHSVSGYVRDAEDGEALIGAVVSAPALEAGVLTNGYGFYSLRVPAGDSVQLQVSYLGYTTVQRIVLLEEDLTWNVELLPGGNQLDDVVIEANSLEQKLNSSQMSMDELTMMEAKQIPALFGEVDIIKTLQLKPGVQSGGEGTSGIYVRGGGPDQNLILLDEAPVYNASHLFGFFSTFNSDAVKDVKLYKGGFPAEYGGKLSSVIDVRLNDGDLKKFSGSGGIGLIASRLTLEAPIVKDKASFMISGRRTYFDVFTRALNRINDGDPTWQKIPDYYFYDLNAKVNYKISDKDQVFLSGYLGRDVFGFNSTNFNVDFSWGNSTGSARWTHLFNPRLMLKTVATFSDYNYNIRNQFASLDFNLGSGIRDYNAKSELTWLPSSRHEIKVGVNYIYHTFSIARFEATSEDQSIDWRSGRDYYGTELGVYINENFKINHRLTLNGGLRLSGFESENTFYNGLEPRLALKYSVSDKVSLKGSFTRMFQYVHMISNSGASLPTDIWYPSNATVNPQRSDQVAAGVSWQISDHLLLTNEAYYKWLKGQVDFRDGAQIFFNPELDEEFVFGKGWGYGNEVYLEKKKGSGNRWHDGLSGWLGYTLSWSWREFASINGGEPFHPRYDRRHDVSLVLIQKISKRINLTGTWVYGTGQAVTLPIGRYFLQGSIPGANPNLVPIYLARNSFRMPSYHRMDLGLVWTFFPKWGESDLTFSIYNFYNRRNPYFIYYDEIPDRDNPGQNKFVPKQVSLFPMIPALTWNFKF